MAKGDYPARVNLDEVKKISAKRDAANATTRTYTPNAKTEKAAVDRANRISVEEAGESKMVKRAKGGPIGKDTSSMMKREIAFMKAKGAPKDMITHEMAEAKSKGMAKGGRIDGCAQRGKTRAMGCGGKVKG